MLTQSIILFSPLFRNRALDGDFVFVQITGTVNESSKTNKSNNDNDINDKNHDNNDNYEQDLLVQGVKNNVHITNHNDNDSNDDESNNDDEIMQQSLWDPIVSIPKKSKTKKHNNNDNSDDKDDEEQYTGKVICVLFPKSSSNNQSEIDPTNNDRNENRNEDSTEKQNKPVRTIVGTIIPLPGNNSNRCLLVPNSRSLPRFMTPHNTKAKIFGMNTNDDDNTNIDLQKKKICCADYIYGSWSNNDKWPPCTNLKVMGETCNIEDETLALLLDNNVNHGEFTPQVLRNVEDAVSSGRTTNQSSGSDQDSDLGWEPTEEMIKGRRDYRKERIFTIDPTTAKDLDDALHIKPLPDGRIEIGVHIADVSFFVKPDSFVDEEAEKRSTTVYLVDRTVPMLPRPLCEIACSLNENVERLAFR